MLQSLVDESGLNSVNSVAEKCAKALACGDGKLATSLWDEAERVIDSVTSGVNLYNILQWNTDTLHVSQNHSSSKLLLRAIIRHVTFVYFYEHLIDDFFCPKRFHIK